MPCSYYMPGEEEALIANKLREDLDRLTHENDILREIVLEHAPDKLPLNLLQEISEKQEAHRKEDLKRLDKTFREKMWEIVQEKKQAAFTDQELLKLNNLITRVQIADPRKPLAPQLGFDPDDY